MSQDSSDDAYAKWAEPWQGKIDFLALRASHSAEDFDVVVVCGRSGYAAIPAFANQGFQCVELPPLRIKPALDRDGRATRPEQPLPPEQLTALLNGKRALFIDDEIAMEFTLAYVTKAVAEHGGEVVGVGMFAEFPADTTRRIPTNIWEVQTTGFGKRTEPMPFPDFSAADWRAWENRG